MFRKNLALLIFSVLMTLIGAEIGLRAMGYRPARLEKVKMLVDKEGKLLVSHPTIGHANRPGEFTQTTHTSYTWSANHLSNGQRLTQPLRAYSDEYSKDQIWILGCSFTYGWSLNDDETYPWLLQKKLPNYDIANFGVIGYGTLQSFLQFRQALTEQQKPKIAIIAYAAFHDERNINLRSRQKRFTITRVRPYAVLNSDGDFTYLMSTPFHEFPLMRYSALIHLLEKAYNRIEDRFYHGHEVSKAIIRAFSDLCKKNEIQLIVAGIMNDSVTTSMLEYAKEQGNFTVDISVDLDIKGNRNLPHDRHPSAIAHKQYAQKLEAFLASADFNGH